MFSVTCDIVAGDTEMRYIMTGKEFVKTVNDTANVTTPKITTVSDDKIESDDEILANFAIALRNKNLANQTTATLSLAIVNTAMQSLPPTPPTSVSRQTTPNGFCPDSSDRDIYDYCSNKEDEDEKQLRPTQYHKRKRTKILSKNNSLRPLSSSVSPFSTSKKIDADFYGDSSDDTSSRGTLDLIIPPPKDFQGFNNPFLSQITKSRDDTLHSIKQSNFKLKTTASNGNVSKTKHPPPLPSVFKKFQPGSTNGRLVRTVKRRLSAKDIMIGPNMEVKRRKLRRNSLNVEVSIIFSFTPISFHPLLFIFFLFLKILIVLLLRSR